MWDQSKLPRTQAVSRVMEKIGSMRIDQNAFTKTRSLDNILWELGVSLMKNGTDVKIVVDVTRYPWQETCSETLIQGAAETKGELGSLHL